MPKLSGANYEPVYNAVEKWVDVGLRHDGSLFTPGRPIWSASRIDDFYTRFVDNPIETGESFLVKLRQQLDGAPDETIQLAAELLYVHLLVAADIYGTHKRNLVTEILSWAGDDPVVIPSDLASALEQGIASTGVAYKTYRYWQMKFLLDFVRAWKQLPQSERESLLVDPWGFKAFVFGLPIYAAYAQREALIHFVHPAVFEAIISRDFKGKISSAFSDLVSDPETDVDRRIAQIRAALSDEYGPDFHFWHPELRAIWDPPTPPKPPLSGTNGPSPPPEALAVFADSLLLDPVYLDRARRLLLDKGQLIFFGPPGTGKTYVARALAEFLAGPGTVELVQFHPSYAYEDFVEGYRPAAVGGRGFELVPGPLKRIATIAAQQPDAQHFLVIDEINRGNVPKVFGELYYLLEYRDREVSLQYSREPFSLPRNLLIIGTMNTVDRSIALVDLALRRRFYFIPFFPDEPPVEGLLRRWLDRSGSDCAWIADVVDKANSKLSDRQVAIGPSHFMRQDLTDEWISLIWEHAVMPTLAEHFFGDESQLANFELEKLRAEEAGSLEDTGGDIDVDENDASADAT